MALKYSQALWQRGVPNMPNPWALGEILSYRSKFLGFQSRSSVPSNEYCSYSSHGQIMCRAASHKVHAILFALKTFEDEEIREHCMQT